MNTKNNQNIEKNTQNDIETLAAFAAKEDKIAFVEIIGIFSPYIFSLARAFKMPESDFDDLCQAGRIALYRAVQSYDKTRAASFTTFARVCVKNAMTSLVREYNTKQKRSATDISLDDVKGAAQNLAISGSKPEDILIAKELMSEIENGMEKCLSESEKNAITHKMSGIGVAEISVIMGKSVKSVENTLFRARKKLRIYLEKND